ncbi:UNVERIFIED_CONTAM: hypothetical protein K2H54_050840, partial [Gekko kuhli]
AMAHFSSLPDKGSLWFSGKDHATMLKYRKCHRKVLLRATHSSQIMQLGKGHFWSVERTENINTTEPFRRLQTFFVAHRNVAGELHL